MSHVFYRRDLFFSLQTIIVCFSSCFPRVRGRRRSIRTRRVSSSAGFPYLECKTTRVAHTLRSSGHGFLFFSKNLPSTRVYVDVIFFFQGPATHTPCQVSYEKKNTTSAVMMTAALKCRNPTIPTDYRRYARSGLAILSKP